MRMRSGALYVVESILLGLERVNDYVARHWRAGAALALDDVAAALEVGEEPSRVATAARAAAIAFENRRLGPYRAGKTVRRALRNEDDPSEGNVNEEKHGENTNSI